MSNIESYLLYKPVLTKAVVGYFLKEDKVILGLRKQVSFGLGENLISGIGGKVGDSPEIIGESDEQAMMREAEEEIGVKIKKLHKVGEITFLFPNKAKWNQFVIAYIIKEWEGEPQETDVIKPLRFQLNELPFERMWADNQYWVPHVLSGKTINATFLYADDNKTVQEYISSSNIL